MENSIDLKIDRIKGALVGLAIGDALGVHLEFTTPGSFAPITTYTEGNPYGIPKGYWTDDTSMALCIGKSLVEKKGFDAEDIMKKFCQWQRKGYMSSTDTCFDIGNTTRHALMEYWRDPSKGAFRGRDDFMSAGNGSIMRLAPIVIFYHDDLEKAIHYAAESSRITHGYVECVDACKYLAAVMWAHINKDLIDNDPGEGKKMIEYLMNINFCPNVDNLRNLLVGEKEYDNVKGTGYVIDSLKAAMWATFDVEGEFEEAVLAAVNLGDDADTTGAVCGQIAGSFYGYEAIPQHLKEGLHQHDMIVELAEEIYKQSKLELTN